MSERGSLDAPILDPELLRLPGNPRIERLSNGLTVCVLSGAQAPVVACALFYRVGARDEVAGEEGIAHFLEHLMFRGSSGYPEGEIDRLTQAWGGSNNAFTSHDATAYHFSFAGERWREALAVEADRMSGLLLDDRAIDLERQVVLEELSMYEDQPWDALEMRTFRLAFREHPYARPIIGERESLARIGRQELAAFHRRYYRADNAVLVLAGAVDERAVEIAEERFAGCPTGVAERSELPEFEPRRERARFEEGRGEVHRLFWTLPAPQADCAEEAPHRLLAALLGTGKSSRLHLRLVEGDRVCAWVSADVSETAGPGLLGIAVEALPGADLLRIEAGIEEEISALRREPPTPDEISRAQRLLVADRAFGSARVEQQAMVAGYALALFDWEYPERQMRRLLAAGREELIAVANDWLDLERASTLGVFRADGAGK